MNKVLFLNNDGNGFAETIEVGAGTTLSEMLELKSVSAGDFMIRVNRETQAADYILQNGDRVTCTPRKIEGA